MTKAKSILLLWALLFASLGGCFGPLMMGRSMNCCSSMPCSPASQSRSCCTPGLSGAASHLQQAAEVTSPTVSYAVMAMLPHFTAAPAAVVATRQEIAFHCYSPPGELYTIHHSLLI
ncbi:MAG: hypothetical protein P8Z30_05405 [Acidobacteriota bacterium]